MLRFVTKYTAVTAHLGALNKHKLCRKNHVDANERPGSYGEESLKVTLRIRQKMQPREYNHLVKDIVNIAKPVWQITAEDVQFSVDEDGEFHQLNLIVMAPSPQERHRRKQQKEWNRASSTCNGADGDDDNYHKTNESNIDKDK